MQQGPPRLRRARPVADAPIDALLLRVEDLTKGWLLALLEQHDLEQAPRILAADLTRHGPRVCDAVVRSIEGAGHIVMVERPGEFLAALEDLLAVLPRRATTVPT